MTAKNYSGSAFSDTKPHYDILDGLRGVAALVVILYHVFECFDWSPAPRGYLAVDFFFVLSGFVIGYAYDDRWTPSKGREALTTGDFFRRRLIRLHPMVVAGAVIGVVCFLIQGSVRWDGSQVGTSLVMLALLLNMFMIPLFPEMEADVRGNGEMFPLNGPNWSLFFEYIGNILYALLLRRLSAKILAVVAVVSGGILSYISLREGYLGVGWTLADGGFWSGLVRMLFPYSVGLLMARLFRPMPIRHAFWWCGAVIVAVACLPAVFPVLQTGFFDALCAVAVFPLLVWMGASEMSVGTATKRVSRFLGDLSYPLYAVHYPLMYLFYARIGFEGDLVPIAKLGETWPEALAVALGSILLAWVCFRFYDLPLRQWIGSSIKKK
ncbi:MAG: acyltransferase [Prevotella sp.]|nr:acyltransferase [Prevotella sp.]